MPKLTQAEQAYSNWENSNNSQKNLKETAEKMGGTIALSDDLYVTIEMPDGSCVVDSACSESTHASIEHYLKIIEEFENQDWI